MANKSDTLTASEAKSLFQQMLLIRRAEERLAKVVRESGLPGALHLYIGQEAVAVGVCSTLTDTDWITSTHRGHGHFLAKGGELKRMYAEIWGKRTGICQGMGGSMHVADFSKGIMGANGIVGGGLAIATGAAHAAKLAGKGTVAVCFFGDGAANQGVMMECMNMAAIWTLPIVFVCENNGVSEFTVSSTVTAGKLSDRATPFMPTEQVDGNDVLAVRAAAQRAVARARAGEGPSFIEATTYRIHGHLEAEELFLGEGRYRTPEEIEVWKAAEKDPLARFQRVITEQAGVTSADLKQIEAHVAQLVDEAVQFAEESEEADPQLVYRILGGVKKSISGEQHGA